MNSLDFVKIACSKDDTRQNLQSVYRDLTHYVACDGHRLHYVNGLPPIETGHYLDHSKGKFPNWSLVVPDPGLVPVFKGSVQMEQEQLKQLKALRALIAITDKKDHTCRVSFGDMSLTFEVGKSTDTFHGTVRLPIFDVTSTEETPVIGFNLSYIFEVLEAAYKARSYRATVEFTFYSASHPAVLTVPELGTAVIMPMRLT